MRTVALTLGSKASDNTDKHENRKAVRHIFTKTTDFNATWQKTE
jgi:hypothetical protein